MMIAATLVRGGLLRGSRHAAHAAACICICLYMRAPFSAAP